MKVVLQRIKKASVEIGGEVHCRIDQGVCLLVGVEKGDSLDHVHRVADKIVDLRIFPDYEGKMNLSLLDTGGGSAGCLSVHSGRVCRQGPSSQF